MSGTRRYYGRRRIRAVSVDFEAFDVCDDALSLAKQATKKKEMDLLDRTEDAYGVNPTHGAIIRACEYLIEFTEHYDVLIRATDLKQRASNYGKRDLDDGRSPVEA